MFDVIVVGGRCAGSAVALLLARKGYRTLVVDRATFPSDTISGHAVLHRGAACLRRWGLLDKVIASNAPPITKVASDFGDFTLRGEVPIVDDAPAAIGPRRTVLDTILAEAAAEAGAELRQGFVMTDLMREDGRVVGIRGQGGKLVSERASIVIGADGKRSKVAQLVEAPAYHEVPSLTCWYMSYWSDYPCDALEIYWRHHRMVITMPTNDGLVLQAVAWPHAEFHDFRRNIEQNYVDTLMMMPDIAERLPGARRVEQFYAMADVPGFFRRPYGPGWALVGDAGHHKDPVPAHGISDAFCDAELLADAIDKGFGGRMDEALAEYEQLRNARALPDYEVTCQRARLEMWDTPDVRQLRAALRGNPEQAGRFCGVITHSVAREDFFSPANMGRIMAALQPQ